MTIPLALLLACPTPEPDAAPEPAAPVMDMVLVTVDTVRADRLGCYGDPLARTPNLDAVAASGALFREAHTPVPLTLPAHASILTGLQPHRHGLRDNGGYRLDAEVPLISEALHEAGWHTAAFVGAYVLDGSWGLDRGFDVYGDGFHPEDVAQAAAFGEVDRPAREVVADALAWWEATEGPRFLWVHLYDAHHPYEPPPEWTADPYRGEIWAVDRALRPLLAAVGAEDLLVVAGDHGESLWDAGELQHGLLLTRSALRVPLLVRPPGALEGEAVVEDHPAVPRPVDWLPVDELSTEGLVLDAVPDAPRAARVVEAPVSLVDLAPTLLDYAGLPTGPVDGRSLRPAVEGGDLEPRPVYSETLYPLYHYGWAPGFSARDGERWLTRAPEERLVATADPWATRPLAEAAPASLAETLDTHGLVSSAQPGPVDAETMGLLQELGYATAVVAAPAGDLPAAADRVHLVHRVALAQGRLRSDPAAARALLEEVLAEDGDMVEAWFTLGVLHLSAQLPHEALAAFGEVLERAPTHALALNNTVIIQRALGLVPEALETTALLQHLNPSDPRWVRLEISLHAKAESPEAVREAATRGVAVDPDDPYFHYMLGLSLIQLDQPLAAIEALEASRDHGSRATDIHMWQGRAHEQLGQVDEAVAAYHRAATDMPTDLRPVLAAGLLLASSDRCGEALPFLFTAVERGVRDPVVVEAYQGCGGAM